MQGVTRQAIDSKGVSRNLHNFKGITKGVGAPPLNSVECGNCGSSSWFVPPSMPAHATQSVELSMEITNVLTWFAQILRDFRPQLQIIHNDETALGLVLPHGPPCLGAHLRHGELATSFHHG